MTTETDAEIALEVMMSCWHRQITLESKSNRTLLHITAPAHTVTEDDLDYLRMYKHVLLPRVPEHKGGV